MSKKISLVKITIDINGKETQLTTKEAEQLYDQLHLIFGKKATITPPTYIPLTPSPRWRPSIPDVFC